ncbi:MAG: DUF4139 domain-containing protein [Alphaproteobacteria bacterium]|nr:DUF4139 domain-containing protein [Alphaproteobacteria bacterium]
MKSLLFLLSLSCSVVALAGETFVPTTDQTELNVTIYNGSRALVKDERRVPLKKGLNEVSFAGVSEQMMPQTALLKGKGISTLEQNFNFDLLTHSAMMKKSVGSEVSLEYIDPATGKITRDKGTLLSYNDGKPVLKIDDKIETNYPGRVVFDKVPEQLRAEPTLTISVLSDNENTENLQLDYLTSGLTWKADYVARVNADETKMDLNGFVTLTNTSGANYKQAQLQLVAGDVNEVREYNVAPKVMMAMADGAVRRSARTEMAAEALADFYLYTLPHKTDILSNQTKQVALLTGTDLGIKKTYELNEPFSVYSDEVKKMKPSIYVSFENTKENKLGKPLPKGTIRLYKEDKNGRTQFVGEDRINHTAENEEVRLKTGTAFNLSADMKRTSFKKMGERTYRGAYEVTFKNGGDKEAVVDLTLYFPTNFKLFDESQKGTRLNSNKVKWSISVPAKGKTTLTYKVQYEE